MDVRVELRFSDRYRHRECVIKPSLAPRKSSVIGLGRSS